MISYLLKLLLFVCFSFIIIGFYYIKYPFHQESFNGYLLYIILLWFIYGVYKIIQIYSDSKKVTFTPLSIFGYFSLHLLILCCIFFHYNSLNFLSGFVLFFKILGYSILPFILVLISIGFGKKILSYIKGFQEETTTFKFLISLGFGFFSFVTLLSILGFLGFYNFYSILFILLLFIGVGFKEIYFLLESFWTYKIKLHGHDLDSKNVFDKIAFHLLSTEFLFIVATLILSVNLINIVRPFPIGWDDLGAYMNIPRIIANASSSYDIGGMFSWQNFTGVGFLFNSTTQAFFLNNVGGILSFIVLTLVIGEFLKTDKKTFINIPILASTVFISMPMVIFQQAKDMKLDSGLFFVSVIVVYLLYYLYHKKEKDILLKTDKSRLIYFFIIGILLGFAFSIKFTTLILILSIIGVISYVRLGVAGFFGFLFIFIALFTKLGLWSMMNVVFSKDNIVLINNIFYIGFFLGLILIFYSFSKNKKVFEVFVKKLAVLFLGIFVALSPWFYKNVFNGNDYNLSIGRLISGTKDSFKIDYTEIYSQKELGEINELKTKSNMSSSGKTQNEDYGRYFGYETGINNYLKLPWNLTMQANQRGEFTDITFIFLALLPALLLFLPYKKKYFSLLIVLVLIFELLFFVYPPSSLFLTSILSNFLLPFGYIFIILLFLSWILFHYLLKDEKLTRLFNINIILTLLYTFLWTISAFGIVWYGITMYFGFLLIISVGSYYLTYYDEKEEFKNNLFRLFGGVVLISIVSIYFFLSTYPHAFSNLKSSGYSEYKLGALNSNEAIFAYHPDYLIMLFTLNIDNDKFKEFIDYYVTNESIKNIVVSNNYYDIQTLNSLLKQLEKDENQNDTIRKDARIIRNNIYKGILNPIERFRNKGIVYRLGTFLKYYISENNKRLFEDSLITNFDTYIYNDNLDITVENMKKLGLSYLLTDLNAATIDNDPRRDLTRRYENLLKTFSSDKLELVETDSICLKIALEDYSNSEKKDSDLEEFIKLGGVNYESYNEDGTLKYSRRDKLNYCYNYILDLLNNNKIDNANYTYLIPFRDFINTNKISDVSEIGKYMNAYIPHGYSALFKIK